MGLQNGGNLFIGQSRAEEKSLNHCAARVGDKFEIFSGLNSFSYGFKAKLFCET